ncbi:GNAT family N-acetyltransferase [Pseudaestuariivita rosea]|uniref:GNAT family N-acetyltransferase n=1 Tax=Pseudaestuariivita rosea TaxID=2763263 RepID=UPI001F19AD57|nr:GNAT family protein [Pseudaestuariivita rosea]
MENLENWAPPPPPGPARIEGQFVLLEQLSIGHSTDLYLQFQGHDDVWRYLPDRPPKDIQGFTDILHDFTSDPDNHFFYAIFDKDSGKWGGFASYWTIQPDAGAIELGCIGLSPSLQRTRAATEAFYLMMKWAFEAGYRRFEWKCNALNVPSRRAAQRLGLSYEGIFRQASVTKGQNRDTAWFAAIDKEWPDLQNAFDTWLDAANFDANGQQIMSLTRLTAPILVKADSA